jgi:hypothetical protein
MTPLDADACECLQRTVVNFASGSRVRIRGIRKQPFADAMFLYSLTVSYGRISDADDSGNQCLFRVDSRHKQNSN